MPKFGVASIKVTVSPGTGLPFAVRRELIVEVIGEFAASVNGVAAMVNTIGAIVTEVDLDIPS